MKKAVEDELAANIDKLSCLLNFIQKEDFIGFDFARLVIDCVSGAREELIFAWESLTGLDWQTRKSLIGDKGDII